MRGIEKLKAGDFNHMSQTQQPDGSVLVELVKRGEDVRYRFRVRDLYGPDERVTEEEIIEVERRGGKK